METLEQLKEQCENYFIERFGKKNLNANSFSINFAIDFLKNHKQKTDAVDFYDWAEMYAVDYPNLTNNQLYQQFLKSK